MKNDILPPKLPRPVGQAEPQLTTPAPNESLRPPDSLPQENVSTPETDAPEVKKPARRRSPIIVLLLILVTIVAVAVAAAGIWLVSALRPVNPADTTRERITVEPGSSLMAVGDQLEQKRLIRNRTAFMIYARLTGAGARLQAGSYSLSPSESTSAIIGHFTSGKVDQFSITFYPGSTLRRLPGETRDTDTDVKSVLLKAGYDEEQIEAAFSKTYSHPLFVGKPQSADLEGYIYGETYKFNGNSTVEQVLQATFDEYYKLIEKNNLIEGFKSRGLSLYQGITLASIIQREEAFSANQKQVAQVFSTRLERGMSLGADPTYQYAAKKADVPPTPSLDSPYNTRKYPGLPPGPIAMPGSGALIAAAFPASGDYLFFVSGDDDTTHFAKTLAEHEANVARYCREKCTRN